MCGWSSSSHTHVDLSFTEQSCWAVVMWLGGKRLLLVSDDRYAVFFWSILARRFRSVGLRSVGKACREVSFMFWFLMASTATRSAMCRRPHLTLLLMPTCSLRAKSSRQERADNEAQLWNEGTTSNDLLLDYISLLGMFQTSPDGTPSLSSYSGYPCPPLLLSTACHGLRQAPSFMKPCAQIL